MKLKIFVEYRRIIPQTCNNTIILGTRPRGVSDPCFEHKVSRRSYTFPTSGSIFDLQVVHHKHTAKILSWAIPPTARLLGTIGSFLVFRLSLLTEAVRLDCDSLDLENIVILGKDSWPGYFVYFVCDCLRVPSIIVCFRLDLPSLTTLLIMAG